MPSQVCLCEEKISEITAVSAKRNCKLRLRVWLHLIQSGHDCMLKRSTFMEVFSLYTHAKCCSTAAVTEQQCYLLKSTLTACHNSTDDCFNKHGGIIIQEKRLCSLLATVAVNMLHLIKKGN